MASVAERTDQPLHSPPLPRSLHHRAQRPHERRFMYDPHVQRQGAYQRRLGRESEGKLASKPPLSFQVPVSRIPARNDDVADSNAVVGPEHWSDITKLSYSWCPDLFGRPPALQLVSRFAIFTVTGQWEWPRYLCPSRRRFFRRKGRLATVISASLIDASRRARRSCQAHDHWRNHLRRSRRCKWYGGGWRRRWR